MKTAVGIAAAVLALAAVGLAGAQNFDSMRLATDLGDVLASEEFCGLTYDQDAISTFIESKVKADDMSFTSTLRMMTDGVRYGLADMTDSQKTAHCRQTERVAKAYGFIKS